MGACSPSQYHLVHHLAVKTAQQEVDEARAPIVMRCRDRGAQVTSWLKYLAFPCWLQDGNGDLSWAEFQALALEACDTWRAGLFCKHKARRFVQVGELQGLKQPVSEEKLRLGCRLKSKT